MAVYLRFSILLFIKVTLTAGLSKTTFTLYTNTQQMNWATAVTFCRDQGQELFRVMSQAEQDFLKSLGQSDGPWYNKNTGKYWSSLHDPDAQNSPGVGYQWQLLDQSSCLAMTAGSWSGWTENEPLNAATSACINMEWSEQEGYKWRSEQCTSQSKVICRKSGGNCSFVTHSGKVITSAQRTLSLSDETSSACQETCSDTSAFQLDCWAAAWKPSTGQCTLYLSDGPFQPADFENSGDAETELYVPQCLESGLDQLSTEPSQSVDGYNPNCTADGAGGASGGGGSSSAAVVTQTSERHMQLLTYFPNTVARPVAKAACSALSAQSTMVMPKDQWTSVEVRQFLSSMDTPSTSVSLFIDHTTRVWLGVRGNSTNGVTWVDGSDASWPEGDTTPSATMNCVIGTAVDDEKLQWDSANCRTDESAFMCQTPSTSSCTNEQRINKIMASDWVQSFTTVDDCDSYCDTHLYNDQECLAFSYVNGTSQSSCYLAYEETTLFDTDNSVFHARKCFQYATYDNSSDAVNAVLYSTSSATTSPSTATLGNTATVRSSAETVTADLASTMTTENDITVTPQQENITDSDSADSTTLVNGAASMTMTEAPPGENTTPVCTATNSATTEVITSSGATSPLGENTTPVNSATNSATTEVITSSGATSPLGENTTPVNSATNSAMTVVTSSGATSPLGENTTPVNSATNSAMTVVTSSEATTQVDSATASTMTEAPSSPGENTTSESSAGNGAMTEATSSLPLETTAETVSSTTDNTEAETTAATTTETTTAVTNTAELPETGQTPAVEGTTSETIEVTGSATEQQAVTSNKKRCPCTRCVHRNSLSTNDTDQDAIVAQIVDSLTIDKKTTSQSRRKYESATDSRKSAQTIGSFGIAVLVVVFSLIVVVDLCGAFCRLWEARRAKVREREQ